MTTTDVTEPVRRFRTLWNEGAWDALDALIARDYVHHVGLWATGLKEYKEMSLKVRGSISSMLVRQEGQA